MKLLAPHEKKASPVEFACTPTEDGWQQGEEIICWKV